MPINLNIEPDATVGKQVLRWNFREFQHVNRSRAWWIGAGLVAAALVIYGAVTGNFLFALIILLAAALFVIEVQRQPRSIECRLTVLGVMVGKKFWKWNELSSFWIAYRPPEVTNLYLLPKSPLDPRVAVPLEHMNPLSVRNNLKNHLEEDLSREDEPTSEALTRLLKLP
jgi:hypothetical protein